MVGFGKFLHDVSAQHGVADNSLNYRLLKKVLNAVKSSNSSENSNGPEIDQGAFIKKLEEEMTSVNSIVKQKLKVLQRVRKALVAARQVRGYKEAQEHGIVLIQLSNVYDDVILVLWFMYLNTIAVSKIVKKYNKNVPSNPYVVDPSKWLFLSAGLAHAQRAKASIEAEFGACVETLPSESETILVERNMEVNELAKGMKTLMQEHKHHLYRSCDPTEWAVIPSLERSQSRRKAPSLSSMLWQGGEEPPKIDEPKLTREYRLGPVIGRGAYGVVCRATQRDTGAIVAVKTIHDTWSHPILGQRTYREIQILQQLRHPNIVELNDVIVNGNNKDVHLIMPFIPHTCEDLLVRRQLLAQHKKWFMLQLLSALAYIHERGVVHRDLKLSNILVDDTPRCYLSDFGLARTLSGGTETTTNDNPDYIQTQWYRAPEVLLCSRKTTTASDMWSVGCILAELLTGVPLFPGQDQQQQLELILACCSVPAGPLSIEVREKFPPSLLPPELKVPLHDIDNNIEVGAKRPEIRRCSSNLVTRRNITEVVNGCAKASNGVCPDKSSHDLIQKLLRFEPCERMSAIDAIQHDWFTTLPSNTVNNAVQVAKPCCGEGVIALELTCTKLHSATVYRKAVSASPQLIYSKREQAHLIQLHQGAAVIQRFWRWRRRGADRPPLLYKWKRKQRGALFGQRRMRRGSSSSTIASSSCAASYRSRGKRRNIQSTNLQCGKSWWHCSDANPAQPSVACASCCVQ
eukprot:TRINITY_DN618_c0_g1_i1.p1 TRINITY_DN618_c0_g1~~TRINITY_DN618_c0_g1_i1.p1  ORF type:complete len:744 (+),score=207.96 TRINITY_DN618_c0_g1_i1:37-2268(+)